jgi:hypothetical protein
MARIAEEEIERLKREVSLERLTEASQKRVSLHDHLISALRRWQRVCNESDGQSA